jgi:predicted outer membrane repeat protein
VLTNNVFRDNEADVGDAGALELNNNNEDSSLLYLFTVTGNTFRNNYADDDGGAIQASAALLLTNNTFDGNTAEDDDGGAVQLDDESAINTWHMVTGNRFTNNRTLNDDGGALFSDSNIVVSSNEFANNYAAEDGGALTVHDPARITKNTFINNRGDNGGAVYAHDLGFPDSSITDNLFEGNSAVNEGGAMWIDDDEGVMDHKVVIASNRVIRNTAKYGAGIYVTYPDGSTSRTQLMSGIIRNSFERNVASLNGGGIMMEYRGGTFSNARAALAALKKAVKNNRYKANKANLDRATGDIGGWAITIVVGALEETEAAEAPEAPSVR